MKPLASGQFRVELSSHPCRDQEFTSRTVTTGISGVISEAENKWREIPVQEIDAWNVRLLKTDAAYRQYPYWNEPYRKRRFAPIYLIYGTEKCPSAYTCVLTVGVPGARIGLVHFGPVILGDDMDVDAPMLQSLAQWAKKHGYMFMRMTHSDQRVFDCIASAGVTERREAFPFHRDPRNYLLINQTEDEQEMLASFNQSARAEIRAATRAGYEIRVSESPQEFATVWPMFLRHAKLKGFHPPSRPLSEWLELIRLARAHNCARLYSAYLNGKRVVSIFAIAHGYGATPMLSALDVEALGNAPSPSCLIHWYAMRDFHRSGCQSYNLGGPGDGVSNHVYQFKRKFRPVLRVDPEPVTLVLKPKLYRLWCVLALQSFITWRARFKRVLNNVLNKKQVTKTIGELAAGVK